MSARPFYLGVDGGGTKTEFVCIDRDHRVVARTVTGTVCHLQVGLDDAVRLLAEGVDVIRGEVSATSNDFEFVFFGLPAFGEDAAIDPQLSRACGALLGHDRYLCGNDMICGWAGSLACEDGINLVAGTGSIGYGERQGHSARVGGWGEVIGDEGSAYWIAIQGLNAFTRMSDERLARGPLHHYFREALSLDADIDLCARIMGAQAMPRDEVADLARIVSQAAGDGDAVAGEILHRAAQELAGLALALKTKLAFEAGERVPLSWSGGVLTREAAVREPFKRILREAGNIELIEPRHPPGYGAALYAAHLANREGRLPSIR